MSTLTFMQIGAAPGWVGPTMAISLAVIALSVLAMAGVVALAALRVAGQVWWTACRMTWRRRSRRSAD